ncbi:MAG: GGDEF domain-containing protein [Rhodospirillales bacterium]|nr:GGDEF domain-containing protein [Rhodospirillales bacterium]
MKSRHAKLAAALVGQGPAAAVKRGAPLGEAPVVLGVPARELTVRMQTAMVALSAEAQGLRDELEQARARIARLEKLADRDVLTPVLNRRAFLRELARVLSFGRRYGQAGSLLYFDLDGLKQINDELGHAAGDAALVHVAETLSRRVRDSDIVGRLGGDEFGVILAQGEGAVAAAKARELTRAVQARSVVFQDRRLSVQVACGAHDLAAGEGAAETLAAADRAMYADKRRAPARRPQRAGGGPAAYALRL